MGLKTGEEYIESLKRRGPLKIYMLGEKIENPIEHPIIRASINSVALTYDLAHNADYSESSLEVGYGKSNLNITTKFKLKLQIYNNNSWYKMTLEKVF